MALWMGMLSGCALSNPTTSTTTTLTTSTTAARFEEYDGYASTVDITEDVLPTTIQWPGLSFQASFRDLTVSPISQVVCVTAYLTDVNYRNATYYLVGRYVGETLEESRRSFVSNTMSASYQTCFSGVRLNRSYEILLAKSDTDVPEAHSTLYSVVTLTLFDPDASRRDVVYGDTSANETPDVLAIDQTSHIAYAPRLIDVGRAIDSITFVLSTREGSVEVERRTVPILETMYAGDRLEVPLQLFESLAPGLEYVVSTTMSGNDGIDDFVDQPVMTAFITAPRYPGQEDAYAQHDLFAVIRGFEAVGDQVVFHYDIVNRTGVEHVFEALIITPGPDSGTREESIALDADEHSFSVPMELLSSGAAVYLKNPAMPSVSFYQRFIDPGINIYFVYYVFGGDGTLTFEIREEDHHETLFCYLEILNESGTVLNAINLQSYAPGQTYTINTGVRYQDHPGIWGRLVYRVETEIGPITHEVVLNLLPF